MCNFSLWAISILHHQPLRSFIVSHIGIKVRWRWNGTRRMVNQTAGPDPAIGVCVCVYINRQVFPIIKEIYGDSTGRPKRFAKTLTRIYIYMSIDIPTCRRRENIKGWCGVVRNNWHGESGPQRNPGPKQNPCNNEVSHKLAVYTECIYIPIYIYINILYIYIHSHVVESFARPENVVNSISLSSSVINVRVCVLQYCVWKTRPGQRVSWI